jgi:transcriptional regulator with XRE-family HTH domain
MIAVAVNTREEGNMSKIRSYSQYTKEAASLLGKLIKAGRKKRQWSELDLAERAGIARETVQRIEKGDPTCSIGLVFEAAFLVGVPLFDSDLTPLATSLERITDTLSLMPKTVRKGERTVDDDF